MKKIILGLVLVIVIAGGIGIYYLLTNLDALVKAAIEKHGSEATQTAVRVDNVKINIQEGSGAILGLTIRNPTGFDLPNAFSLAKIKIAIDYKSLKEQPYVIDEITVRAPQIFFEINNDKKNNLNELKKKLSIGKSPDKSSQEVKQSDSSEPRLIIKRIRFTDGNMKAMIAPLDNKKYELKMPTLLMSNLGGKKGLTPSELANEIIARLIDQAKKEIREKGLDAEMDKLKAKAKEKVDAEKNKLKEKADDKLEQEKKKTEDKLKGLLNKQH